MNHCMLLIEQIREIYHPHFIFSSCVLVCSVQGWRWGEGHWGGVFDIQGGVFLPTEKVQKG